MNNITFFSRFEADILAGKKTITIRDKSESYFQPQQELKVFTNETNRFFAHIRVISITPIHFEQLNEQHAKQENMSLAELKQVIRDIYPNDNDFFVIEFELI
ncbi:N(4)-acetylcytidine aminohydrolase [Actinobacillus equuli subsp. equuli]|uniref:N(4)-acetylcytidine amidohydrolase n=1 Tax=Actinobacillus equuli subsp. equuli TaxID=202947 RepID=A0A9X4JCU1_ACTEU|nr:N(4)-acetylcytidine aminohydrolase [Actinobacillus equuli]MDE8033840.1 N(4)-acetylcytidine aminohydrolase [Actinobacillus equuli subsp. equuli]MDG4948110.1 N(4)-acetylcytidine aminohydrolase [Actinobacillus equuli subsp. haemolyticus]WGE45678.1 N(4)-acetylcytidine aminohydrolase [Actinobacillus equuli subsp. haemolyticus]WGE47774.1 N(4)-acetylcytidine aminohydrolase [Actinobacillus equuli subsp. equuli]WGE49880.1 N(4)-acetylcytidine aminohydrolase [Actinobacillus equuli subsp. haemolyticus]